MADPAEIARSLTKAQKKALLWLPADGSERIEVKWVSRRLNSIGIDTNGVVDARAVYRTRWTRAWRLAPLGLAVRAALEAEGGA